MLGVYLSGTGNTEHCVHLFVNKISMNPVFVPIENPNVLSYINKENEIVLGYPIQFSNAPKMIRDFIHKNKDLWNGKNVFIIVTMGAFSGDGSGCTARILKRYGANIEGALQIQMPDSVCDSKLLKKTYVKNVEIIKKADDKIVQAIAQIHKGKIPREGLSFLSHIIGLFGQRLWYLHKRHNYSNEIRISDACVGCGLCTRICPMHNLTFRDGSIKPEQLGRCTMCYRCISSCPKQAITLLGQKVIEQTRYEKFSV